MLWVTHDPRGAQLFGLLPITLFFYWRNALTRGVAKDATRMHEAAGGGGAKHMHGGTPGTAADADGPSLHERGSERAQQRNNNSQKEQKKRLALSPPPPRVRLAAVARGGVCCCSC